MTRYLDLADPSLEGLEASELGLLVTLHKFADAGGTCFPSHETIAAELKRSRRWVIDALKRLESLGRIKVTVRISKSGKASNVYSLRDVKNLHIANSLDMQNLHIAETAGSDLPNGQTPDAARCAKSAHELTQESKNTPTPRASPVVVAIRTALPQGWVPSSAVVQQAIEMFPDATDQELAEHTAKFTLRCRAKGYPYADFDAAWLDWFVRDRKEAKEKANAAGHRHESPFERQQRDARERAAENRRRADDCLARINGRHPRH